MIVNTLNRLVSGRYFDLDKELFVSANYEYNHNIDFELTKNDIRDIKNGRLSDELLLKIELDLSMLDNNPKYYKFDDREVISYDIDIPKDQEFYTDSLYDDLRALISKAMYLLAIIFKVLLNSYTVILSDVFMNSSIVKNIFLTWSKNIKPKKLISC